MVKLVDGSRKFMVAGRYGLGWMRPRRMRIFLALRWAEKCLLLLTLVMIPLTILGLRLCGFKRWFHVLNQLSPRPNHVNMNTSQMGSCNTNRSENTTGQINGPEAHRLSRTLRMLRLTIRRSQYPGNCLSQSLTLWWLLRWQGIDSVMRIGVRTEVGEFQAHAWVEYQGQPLNDDRTVHERFQVFDQQFTPSLVNLSVN